MAEQPVKVRQRVKQYETPKTVDLIFFERREAAGEARTSTPTYGDAHPDTVRWPNHKLCFIEPEEGQGLGELWYYVEDRTSQEDWSYDITFPFGGDTNYPRITRRYVLPRATGIIPLPLGYADPGGSFISRGQYRRPGSLTDTYRRPGGSDTYLRPNLAAAVLVAQSVQFMEGKIGSLYVLVTRIFDVIPGSDDTVAGSGFTQKDSGYKVTTPLHDVNFQRLEWKITLPRVTADNNLGSTRLQPCPITNYTDLVLIDEIIKASDENDQMSDVIRIYEGPFTGGSQFNESTVYRLATEKSYPGSIQPEKFISNIITVTKALPIREPITAAVTDSAPAGYTLIEVKITPESALRGEKVLVYALPTVTELFGEAWDDNLQAYVPYTVEVMAKEDADALSSEATPGSEITRTPINAYWTAVTTETPAPADNVNIIPLSGGFVPDLGTSNNVSWYADYPYRWPAVLTLMNPPLILAPNGELYADYRIKPAQSGLYKAKFQVCYTATNPITLATALPIQNLHTTPIQIRWPGKLSINIQETLHETWLVHDLDGVFTDVNFAATNPADWPASVCAVFSVKPYKGGFIWRRIDVFAPAYVTS